MIYNKDLIYVAIRQLEIEGLRNKPNELENLLDKLIIIRKHLDKFERDRINLNNPLPSAINYYYKNDL